MFGGKRKFVTSIATKKSRIVFEDKRKRKNKGKKKKILLSRRVDKVGKTKRRQIRNKENEIKKMDREI